MNMHAPSPSLVPHLCGQCGARDSDPTWHRQPVAGVRPQREHVHEWTDAPDDETAWYCPGCGVTEYPDEPPYGAEPVAVARRTDPDTSWEAARSQSAPKMTKVQRVVLELFAALGPMTDEKAWRNYLAVTQDRPELRVKDSGFRTRRSELVKAGLLRDTGERKRGSTGRSMIVWAAV